MNTNRSTVCISLADQETSQAVRWGVMGITLGVMALSAWAALAPLGAAVVAEGTVKALGNRKIVQHAEGGIVAIIHVKDGDRVIAGQTLITLSDQRVAAGADALHQLWISETLKTKRLEAESQALTFALGLKDASTDLAASLGAAAPAFQGHIATTLHREQQTYSARARQQAEQERWLGEQREQIKIELQSNSRLIEASSQALQLAQHELATHEKLRAEGFVSEIKLLEQQRTVADYRSRLESQYAALTQAKQKEADTNLRIANLRSEYVRLAADELKETTQKLAQLKQELRPALDAQTRQKITAPVAGEIVDLKIHTIGSSIAPREPVLEIVPSASKLIIEARISPQDIRDVQGMLHASNASRAANISPYIMLTAYRARATPQVAGEIIYVGADRLTDPATRQPYYIAHISVSEVALLQASQLAGLPLVLSPGMQAEVFLPTQERSAFHYLIDPILDGVRRSMRER